MDVFCNRNLKNVTDFLVSQDDVMSGPGRNVDNVTGLGLASAIEEEEEGVRRWGGRQT